MRNRETKTGTGPRQPGRLAKGSDKSSASKSSSTTGESTSHKLARLLHWDDIEEWQRDNHFIHSGYVRSSSSFKAVAHSLSYFHNETGNIYTHLVPAVLVLLSLLAIYDRVIPIDHSIATLGDHIAFWIFGASLIICLGLSATFHTIKSHSEYVMRLGNMLDYFGICVLVAGSMVAIVYFGFQDAPRERNMNWILTSVLGTICGGISLNPKFKTPKWRPFRASMFVLYGLSGLVPVIMGISMFGFERLKQRVGLNWLVAEAFFYILGAFLYGILFPEKWWPGKFDRIGHSHQIFHVLVVVAAGCHFQALVLAFKDAHLRSDNLSF